MQMELNMSAMSIDRVMKIFSAERPKGIFGRMELQEMQSMFGELKSRLIDELGSRVMLVLPYPSRELYQQDKEPPFGQQVYDVFPDAIDHVSEAAKCLALDRATACVFHLMCVMEKGLQGFAVKLQITIDPTSEWQVILDKIIKPINSMPSSTPTELKNREEYLEIYADIHAVRRAWRNPSIHARKHFSIEQATQIYSAVNAFMRDLAKLI
jgi:hypothetical protein